ncbi:hypothetical protein BDU57DRAFT_129357 [Ampelomyces quisqualis]|uniref:Uncharacterized protein n=1 Tax=Ampelomyces quisqualis TaxID=50730 RepID=A0A6A5QTT1_AMPQU|nr:hypothetical protein BDU57DRAFT_129357 [Ampelomyces quisqualis]
MTAIPAKTAPQAQHACMNELTTSRCMGPMRDEYVAVCSTEDTRVEQRSKSRRPQPWSAEYAANSGSAGDCAWCDYRGSERWGAMALWQFSRSPAVHVLA